MGSFVVDRRVSRHIRAAGGTQSYADMLTPKGLADIAAYADRVAPPTRLLIPLAADGRLAGSSGVAVNPTGSVAEIRRYLAEGLDGFFADDPKLGREAVDGV